MGHQGLTQHGPHLVLVEQQVHIVYEARQVGLTGCQIALQLLILGQEMLK